jgi:hypothetical protein
MDISPLRRLIVAFDAQSVCPAVPAITCDASPMNPPSPRYIDTWELAERNAADWLRYFEYRDVQLSGQGADGGIDIRPRGSGEPRCDNHRRPRRDSSGPATRDSRCPTVGRH